MNVLCLHYLRVLLITLALVVGRQAHAQEYQPIFPTLTGADLLQALQQDYTPRGQLDYSTARDSMFLHVWRDSGRVACQYTGFSVDLPDGVDPSTHLFDQGINTEHLYPRSKGADFGNALADMHHLYPTREGVNGDRASLPFAEIDDAQTLKWYYLDRTQTNAPPSAERDAWSEYNGAAFEPREEMKGDIARAMMYFYTIYRNQALAADPDFFEQQRSTLCEWFDADPVSAAEYLRSERIAAFQSAPNPFTEDCTLPFRLGYCDAVSQACRVLDNADPAFAKTPQAYPNPTSGQLTITDLPANARVLIYDALGRQVQIPDSPANVRSSTAMEFVLPKGLAQGWSILQDKHSGWQQRIFFAGSL